jgi:hypothetical protein
MIYLLEWLDKHPQLNTGGFVINGELAYDKSGWSVSSAGDVNGDGIPEEISDNSTRAVSFLPNTTYDFPTLYFLIAYILPPVSAV